jgi:DNA repair protein RecO (recombination protein O)
LEEYEITGIVLSAMPYKEKDKLLQVFSVELGVISCIMKGVSASNAKLKSIAQPFCFAKFELTKSNSFYVVKGANVIDSFFELTIDYDQFVSCSTLLEICKIIMKPNIISESLFLSLIKTLQNIVYNGIDYRLACSKFLLSSLQIIGYALNFEVCDNCNMEFMGNIKFNHETGTFRCSNCSGGIVIDKVIITNLKIINSISFEKLQTIKVREEVLNDCLKLLYKNIENRLNCKIKSLNII